MSMRVQGFRALEALLLNGARLPLEDSPQQLCVQDFGVFFFFCLGVGGGVMTT